MPVLFSTPSWNGRCSMAEETRIEWADHIDPNASGRVLGAYKVAARRTGCTLEEWIAQRSKGRLWCFQCRSWKAHGAFVLDKSRRGGRASRCKPCISEASTAARHGMTIDQLKEFRDRHGNKCGICATTRSVVVDHHHATGRVRGLLCQNCNSAIGKLQENPALFLEAIKYLERRHG